MLDRNICLNNEVVLVTGAAGFIGSHLVKRLLLDYKGIRVVGIDSLCDYYDVTLKDERLAEIESLQQSWPGSSWTFIKGDISDKAFIDSIFEKYHFTVVVNFAAQAGVRYSIISPETYITTNINGFFNILESCRHYNVKHFVYASSSSVYGNNSNIPYSVGDNTDEPISLYAATKKSNEMMAHAYAKLYDIPSTGIRFFTVYGPAGRPDMAYFSFADKLCSGRKISLYNHGKCRRDFTFIDDAVEAALRVLSHAPNRTVGEDGLPVAPYRIYNIGNSSPEELLDFVNVLSEELVEAGVLPQGFDIQDFIEYLPAQPGDVSATYAEISDLERDFGFRPSTSLRSGLRAFARWYASRR